MWTKVPPRAPNANHRNATVFPIRLAGMEFEETIAHLFALKVRVAELKGVKNE